MKRSYLIAILLVALTAAAGYFFLIRKSSETPKSEQPTIQAPTSTSDNPTLSEPKSKEPSPSDGKVSLDEVYNSVSKVAECLSVKHKLPEKEFFAKSCNAQDLAILKPAFQCLLDKGICEMGDLMAKLKEKGANIGEIEEKLPKILHELSACAPAKGQLSKACESIGGI